MIPIIRYIIKHKGNIIVLNKTLDEIEQGMMDEHLMQKSVKFRNEDGIIRRDIPSGYKDRFGRDIYESDVIAGHNNEKYGGNGTAPTRNVLVEYVGGKYYAGGTQLERFMNEVCTPGSVELMGNINLNPELLIYEKKAKKIKKIKFRR